MKTGPLVLASPPWWIFFFFCLAVDGAWAEWTPWSLCSSTCGRGYRDRTRTCRSPQNGGEPCEGPSRQNKLCNIAVCPGEMFTPQKCHFTIYTSFVQKCRKPSSPVKKISRIIIVGFLKNHICFLSDAMEETVQSSMTSCADPLMPLCFPLVDGHWNEWSVWSPCSASCSNGTMQRTRECNGPSYGGSECHGSWKEAINCFQKECPGKKN